jgi:tryptophan 2-monooxygenase
MRAVQMHIRFTLPRQESAKDNWLPQYPNPADFRFDYFRLLKNAAKGLAKLPANAPRRVAVVGAGVAGMTVARELLRCGFEITLFEASERIGGRLYTEANPMGLGQTGMEMGAMRMPFFPTPGSNNCLLEYYLLDEAGLDGHAAQCEQFPNPGSARGNTGIYLNQGYGPDPEHRFPRPQLIAWPYGGKPDNEQIAALAAKVERYIDFFVGQIKGIYVEHSDRWPQLWDKIIAHYGSMTFDDLVMAPSRIDDPHPSPVEDGDFGGFGMNAREAELLYTIGTGDGSWGAFYSIGALWFIRCTMFGFGGTDLQTVKGLAQPDTLPYYGQPVRDSLGRPLPSPRYQGIQAVAEYQYYCPAPGCEQSLHTGARLLSGTWVRAIRKCANGIEITYQSNPNDPPGKWESEEFDYVFVTAGQWASQLSFRFEGFGQQELPQAKITAQHTQHNISSCKLFFPLTERYWERPDNKIPQVLVTDTVIQDAYALAWEGGDDKGVILASYTWEDDSLKLLPFDQKQLVEIVTAKLSAITKETVGQDITEYFVKDRPVMIQWIRQPSYDGCAKLYRQRDESANSIDLAYNQDYGASSRLYFAGENYGVEGGWTEPALRSAIDGVMQLLRHVGATFTVEGFDFERDYPRWGKSA